jgi:valyl-tRNA synthetase
LADYAVKENGVAYILPLNQTAYDTASAQLASIKSLSSKTPIDINVLPVGSAGPAGSAVFPVSAEANVYLEVKDRVQDAGKEVEKFKAKLAEAKRDQESNEAAKVDLSKLQDIDATEARQLVERRTLDIDARLRALEETVAMFQKLVI